MPDVPLHSLDEVLRAVKLHGCTEYAVFDIAADGESLRQIDHRSGKPYIKEPARIAALQSFRRIIGDCLSQGCDNAVAVEPAGVEGCQYCLVLLVPNAQTPQRAGVFVLRCRNDGHAALALQSLRAETPAFCEGRPYA